MDAAKGAEEFLKGYECCTLAVREKAWNKTTSVI